MWFRAFHICSQADLLSTLMCNTMFPLFTDCFLLKETKLHWKSKRQMHFICALYDYFASCDWCRTESQLFNAANAHKEEILAKLGNISKVNNESNGAAGLCWKVRSYMNVLLLILKTWSILLIFPKCRCFWYSFVSFWFLILWD